MQYVIVPGLRNSQFLCCTPKKKGCCAVIYVAKNVEKSVCNSYWNTNSLAILFEQKNLFVLTILVIMDWSAMLFDFTEKIKGHFLN
jgi:hypothetical protein